MAEENLLVRITETVGARQAENVASGALTYFLQRDAGVRRAFVATVERLTGVALPPDLTFRGQVAATGLGVVDIVGVAGGAEVLIIEAKILAGLGAGQAATYLRRLRGSGVLAVLVPEARLGVVFAEARRQCDAELDGPLRARRDGTVLLGLSWETVLGGIDGATQDAGIRNELDQLAGLYRRLESASFIPFSSDDLSRRAARLWSSLDSIVVRVKAKVGASPTTDDGIVFPPRYPVRGGEHFFGVWLTLSGFNAWFGRHTMHWANLHESPFWLQLNQLNQAQSDQILAALGEGEGADDALPAYRRSTGTDLFVPLRPPVGVDAEAVVEATITQLHAVVGRLRADGLKGPYSGEAAGAPPTDQDPAV